ncbi:MAG TPA: hypothetical protein VG936_02835 [Lacunisphaera sp.]|nr:hypothetical protein [Lacunisphaera sp.]
MNLVWHIIAKDVRRLRLPLGLWLAVVLAHTGMLWLWTDAGLTRTAFEGLGIYLQMWGLIVAAVGFILAAWLVMEDSLVDSQAFWPTRPISGARLLAAKVLGAVAMFGVAPVLVLTPVWLACGFSAGEWLHAAVRGFINQSLLSLAAFALAAMTNSAGQFLVRAVGLVVGLPVLLLFACGRISLRPYLVVRPEFSGGMGIEASKYGVALGLTLACAAAVVLHQYLTRRTTRSGAIVAGWLVLLIVVRYGWAWDLTNEPDSGARADPAWKFSAAVRDPGQRSNGEAIVNLDGQASGAVAGSYAVVRWARGHWTATDGHAAAPVWFRRPPGPTPPPAPGVVLQVAGLAAGAEDSTWQLTGRVAPGLLRPGISATLNLGADAMRGRVLGQLPLHEGALLQVGSSRTRLAKLEPVDGKTRVTLREQDAGMNEAVDAYVLFSPSRKLGWVLEGAQVGTVQVNSIQVRLRQLVLDPPANAPDDLAILKVRFQPVRIFAGPVTAAVVPKT